LVTHPQIEQSYKNSCWKEIDREVETRKKEPSIREIDTTPK